MKPYFAAPGVQIFHGMCQEVIASSELPVFRTVLTDPPYWGQAYVQAVELQYRAWEDAEEAKWLHSLYGFYRSWLPTILAITHAGEGRCWLMASPHHLPAMVRIAMVSDNTPREVWYATDCAGLALYGRPIPREDVLHVADAFRRCRHMRVPESWFLDTLLEVGGADGPVLDPFMGAGSTLLAARRAGCVSVGIEKDENLCEQAATAWLKAVAEEAIPVAL